MVRAGEMNEASESTAKLFFSGGKKSKDSSKSYPNASGLNRAAGWIIGDCRDKR